METKNSELPSSDWINDFVLKCFEDGARFLSTHEQMPSDSSNFDGKVVKSLEDDARLLCLPVASADFDDISCGNTTVDSGGARSLCCIPDLLPIAANLEKIAHQKISIEGMSSQRATANKKKICQEPIDTGCVAKNPIRVEEYRPANIPGRILNAKNFFASAASRQQPNKVDNVTPVILGHPVRPTPLIPDFEEGCSDQWQLMNQLKFVLPKGKDPEYQHFTALVKNELTVYLKKKDHSKFMNSEFASLKNYIEKLQDSMSGHSFYPMFHRTFLLFDTIIIECLNKQSVRWLKSYLPNIMQVQRYKKYCMPKLQRLPQMVSGTFLMPPGIEDIGFNEHIFRERLNHSYPSLSPLYWQLRSVLNFDFGGRAIIYWLDQSTARLLKNCDGYIHYMTGKLMVKLDFSQLKDQETLK